MARLYHPNLGVELDWDVPDAAADVLAESGWKVAPEPEGIPGHEPEPTIYEPVKPAKASAKKSPS